MTRITKYFFLAALLISPAAGFAGKDAKVYFVPVNGVIDLGLSAFIERSCEAASKNKAELVVFEIDTFGGRVDAAVNICDSIASISNVPVVAYVTGEAWSAGALIALACDDIIMTSGSSIGSAEPRGGTSGEAISDEKIISALRAKFRAEAERNGHSTKLAEAMVDKDIGIILAKVKSGKRIFTTNEWETLDSRRKKRFKSHAVLLEKGKLLNITAKEAKRIGLAKEILDTRQAVLGMYKMEEHSITEPKLLWSEVIVRFITHPVVSSLLLTLGFLGIVFELKIPGWGLAGTLGFTALALFFWGHYLAGLANWIEILIFIAGVILLFIEILVIPGFGIAGGAGITLILLGMFLALIKHPFKIPRYELMGAFYVVAYAFLFSLAITVLSIKLLPKSLFWKKIILNHKEDASLGYTQDKTCEAFLGKQGIAVTQLRPVGKAEIDGHIMDVETDGEFLDKGAKIEVCGINGSTAVVRKA